MRIFSFCIAALLVAVPALAMDKNFTNSIGMEFVAIPGGSFMMGCQDGDECSRYEQPQHRVTISRSFYMGKYEVTQAQWQAVMGNNPSKFQGADLPVDTVSWLEVQEFIDRLNKMEGGERYRLPSEAEWEYAARAGSETAFSLGDDEEHLEGYAWYEDNSEEQTHPVGQKEPNAWGLYDMTGNVWEWVHDWYDANYYGASQEVDPMGPDSGPGRVFRGGSWDSYEAFCRNAYRYYGSPQYKGSTIGFRLVLVAQ